MSLYCVRSISSVRRKSRSGFYGSYSRVSTASCRLVGDGADGIRSEDIYPREGRPGGLSSGCGGPLQCLLGPQASVLDAVQARAPPCKGCTSPFAPSLLDEILTFQETSIELFRSFLPQLCYRSPSSSHDGIAKLVNNPRDGFLMEEKLDGERMQLHMRGNGAQWYYCSRKAKDYSESGMGWNGKITGFWLIWGSVHVRRSSWRRVSDAAYL